MKVGATRQSFAAFCHSSSSTSTKSTANDDKNSNEPQLSPSITKTSDPPILTWVETALPLALVPYARLARIDKPIGTMLLVRFLLFISYLAVVLFGFDFIHSLS
jgi:hypothetical protein